MLFAAFQLAADLHNADRAVRAGNDVFALLGGLVGVEILQLLRCKEGHVTVQADDLQRGELPAQLVGRCAHSVHDIAHGFLQKFQRAVFLGDHALPVPLVNVDAVQIVQLLVAADGVHIGDQTLTGAVAVLVQGIALPLGKAVNDLGVVVQAGDIELHGALHAVQVVVQAAALRYKQGRGDAVQVQRQTQLFLKDRLDQSDCLLGVVQPQQAFVILRYYGFAHNNLSFFLCHALANWLWYSAA